MCCLLNAFFAKCPSPLPRRVRCRLPFAYRLTSQLLAVCLVFPAFFFASQLEGQDNVSADQSSGTDVGPDYSAAVQRLATAVNHEVADKKLPAFSIALVDGDRIIWSDGFGYQDLEKKVPATAETIYRVGSISKLFTDIAVMQLVERGELNLDAPIETYLPDFRPRNQYGIPLTLRQMMSHRSGLVRESPVGHYFDSTEPTLEQTVESLNATTLVYEPETRTKYSNAAIAVVGAALESQLEVSHAGQVRASILDPLSMTDSSFVVTDSVDAKLATGWMWAYDDRRPFVAPQFLLGTGPAGNLYSSVQDLSKFLVCLFNEGSVPEGRLVSTETFRTMITPVKDASGRPQSFGIGFHLQEMDGLQVIGHGGAVYGFSTQLAALPERRLGAVGVASLDGANGVVKRLVDYSLRLMIATQDGSPMPAYPTTTPVATTRAAELIGDYRSADPDAEGNAASVAVNELDGEVFLRYGTRRRRLGSQVATGRVVTDDVFGFGTEVKLRSDGSLLVGNTAYERVPDQPPLPVPSRWETLIGEYGEDHNVLYILENQGTLFALIEWFYYYPLVEVDEVTFEFPDYGLYHGERLRFHRDDTGRISHIVAAEVKFDRRDVGGQDGGTFQIEPVKPIAELREIALAASPPAQANHERKPELVDLVSLDPTIKLDVRYATTNNFTGAVFYNQARAFLQRPAAEALVRVNAGLKRRGLGLLVHDAYRPWHVTKMFWDATPDEMKDFVANPATGSRHNRGCAVDLTLYDLKTGQPIEMVAGYDEFSQRSFPLYPGGTSRQRWHRDLLRRSMESEGFEVYEYEWWHFDYKDWRNYAILNATFEELD